MVRLTDIANPKEGDRVACGISQGDTRLVDVSFTARTVEGPTSSKDAVVMWFMDTQTFYQDGVENRIEIGQMQKELTADDVALFLSNTGTPILKGWKMFFCFNSHSQGRLPPMNQAPKKGTSPDKVVPGHRRSIHEK